MNVIKRGMQKTGLFICAAILTACAGDQTHIQQTLEPSVAKVVDISRDREAILAMAGDYSVTFDFRETTAFQVNYKPKDTYITHAQEIVRVIEDRGDFISLQHILLVGDEQKFPIKHWRQDWSYEPSSITRFIGGNGWENTSLPEGESKGKWAQIVYQVDDGPRYAGLGTWNHDAGFAEWASDPTLRPLPRRDATKRSDYHAIEAVNRHAITPDGWVHEQDNTKLVLDGTKKQALVREIGVNTYTHDNSIETDTALSYWRKTKDFWREIRAEWTQLETETPMFGLTIQGEPEELYMQILGIASDIADGEINTKEAAADARQIIKDYTYVNLAPLQARLLEASKLKPSGS